MKHFYSPMPRELPWLFKGSVSKAQRTTGRIHRGTDSPETHRLLYKGSNSDSDDDKNKNSENTRFDLYKTLQSASHLDQLLYRHNP